MCAVQLEVRNIAKTFESGVFAKKPKSVLENISLKVHLGQTFGIVGDSGSGKTTLGKIMVGIEKATTGQILFYGKPLEKMTKEAFSGFRRKVQMLFQDPEGSLNPKKTIQKSLDEILFLIKMPLDARTRAIESILQTVGLPTEVLTRYPNQISGGQNQRIALARILLLEPEIIILDEPTSALDISVQAQILNLLKELQKQKGLTYVFISHDRDVIEFMCHDVGTLAQGNLAVPTNKANMG
ncbi:MAG: ABC transporter ATP-binding protein [Candidatus Aminicenantes bacterium]|nr:MAG: ABC transporter ATP-binding protein [Candidatus Aminicenantes bacterium]